MIFSPNERAEILRSLNSRQVTLRARIRDLRKADPRDTNSALLLAEYQRYLADNLDCFHKLR